MCNMCVSKHRDVYTKRGEHFENESESVCDRVKWRGSGGIKGARMIRGGLHTQNTRQVVWQRLHGNGVRFYKT